MNILVRYIHKYLKMNKITTFLSILSIAVASALFFIMTSLCVNTYWGIEDSLINTYGNYHVRFDRVQEDFTQALELHTQISQIDYVEEIEIMNLDSCKIYLFGMEQDVFEDLGFVLMEGNYPTKENEVVLTETFLSEAHLPVRINETIEIEGHEFYVSGILSTSFFENDEQSFVFMALPKHLGSIHAFVRFDERINSQRITEILASSFQGKFDSYHLNGVTLVSEYLYSDLGVAATLIFILVIFLAINMLLIRNSYKNAYLNREKHLAVLKSVGVTQLQCRTMILYEGFLLMISGLVLGLFMGYMGFLLLSNVSNHLLLSISENSFVIEKRALFTVGWLTVLYTACLSLVFINKSTHRIVSESVSTTLSTSDEVVTHQPYLCLSKKMPFQLRLFVKNIRQNIRSYVHLIVGCIVVMSLLLLLNSLMGYVRDGGFLELDHHNYDVKLSFKSDTKPSIFFEQIKESENSQRVVITEKLMLVTEDKTSLNKNYRDFLQKNSPFELEIIGYEDEILKEYLDVIGNITLDDLKDLDNPLGILINQMYDSGHRRFYPILEGSQLNSLSYDGHVVIPTLHLYGSDYLISGTDYQKKAQILVSDEMLSDCFQKTGKQSHEYHLYFQCSDANAMVRELNSLKEENFDAYQILNVQKLMKNGNSIITLFRLFSYGYIIMLTIMSILAFCCIISTNFEYRRREFLLFHIMGLRIKEMMEVILMEIIFYLLILVISSWIISQSLNFALYQMFFKNLGLSFFFPENSLLGSFLFMLLILVSGISIIYLMIRIQKKTDVLKNDISWM